MNLKQMNQHWHWQTWQDCAYLTCDLLSPWQHGFFTQAFYPRTPQDLTSIWQSGESQELRSLINPYRVQQIHGNLVLTPQEITDIVNQPNYVHELACADAVMSDRFKKFTTLTSIKGTPSDRDTAMQSKSLKAAHPLTQRPQQSVWAASADCTPVLIGDLVTGQVCAVHAGWRGTAQKIVPRAIARFLEFGSRKSDLRIAIGPAISGKMYQVDEQVAVEVGQTIMPDVNLESEILTKLQQLPQPPILADDLPGKVRLDVPRINHVQLEQLEIDSAQIAIAPYCTFEQSDLFFSYRRTGEKKVQWSGIVSK